MGGDPGRDNPTIRPVRVEVEETESPVPDFLPWLDRIKEAVDPSETPFLVGLPRFLEVSWSDSKSEFLGLTRFELNPNELMRRRRMSAPSGPVKIELNPILVGDQALLDHTFVHELLHAAGLTEHDGRHAALTASLAPPPSLSESPVLQRLRSAVIDGQDVQGWVCMNCNSKWKRSTVSRPKRCPHCARSEVQPDNGLSKG
ncbi:MAG: hypothetical protein QGH13_04185 [Candidatus Thalassarchaeaceae archaeon]|nr:hypothetical protein [Candidatus Thalassarchaeaceae archaeon]